MKRLLRAPAVLVGMLLMSGGYLGIQAVAVVAAVVIVGMGTLGLLVLLAL